MSPEVESVWKASNDYVALANAFLQPEDNRHSEGNALWRKGEYRVCFLFPNSPERSRLDLCKVRCRFVAVGDAQRAELEEKSQGSCFRGAPGG